MENRIQINGDWYVKEDSIKKEQEESQKLDYQIYQTRELVISALEIYITVTGTVIEYENGKLSKPVILIEDNNRNEQAIDSDDFIKQLAGDNPDWDDIAWLDDRIKQAVILIAKRMVELKWV